MGSSSTSPPPPPPPKNEIIHVTVIQNVIEHPIYDMEPPPTSDSNLKVEAFINGEKHPVHLDFKRNSQNSNDLKNDEKTQNSPLEQKPDNSNSISNQKNDKDNENEFFLINDKNDNNNHNNGEQNKEIVIDKNDINYHEEKFKPPVTDFGHEEEEEKNNENVQVTKGGNIDNNLGGNNRIDYEVAHKSTMENSINNNDNDKNSNINNNEGSVFQKIKESDKKECIDFNPSESDLSISQSKISIKDSESDRLAQSMAGIQKGYILLFLIIDNRKPEYFMVKGEVTLRQLLNIYFKNISNKKKINDINLYYENRLLDKNTSLKYLNLPDLCQIYDKMKNPENN